MSTSSPQDGSARTFIPCLSHSPVRRNPAGEVFGIRMPKGKEGDMTRAQHCAEFYLPGYGGSSSCGRVESDPERKITLQEAQPLR